MYSHHKKEENTVYRLDSFYEVARFGYTEKRKKQSALNLMLQAQNKMASNQTWQLWILLFLSTAAYLVQADPKKALFFFQQAISRDDQEGIRKAAADGADINFVGAGGQTALLNAVLRDKVETVKTLLDLGADVTIPEKVRHLLKCFFYIWWYTAFGTLGI